MTIQIFPRLTGFAAPLSLAATMALGFSAQASAFSLGQASDFNVFVLGNLEQSNVDTEGRMAVGGNATLTDYGVGVKLTNSNGTRNDLIVGGNLTYTRGKVFNGNAVYGGTVNLSLVGIPNGTAFQGNPIDFATAGQELLDLSAYLGGLSANGTTNFQYGQVTLNGSGSGLNVFNLLGSDLSAANTFTINADPNATVLVNITGETINFGNFGFFLNGVDKQNVLYNFVDAKNLSSNAVGIQGSLLAPKATYQFDNGNIDGTLIAGSLKGGGESHPYLFKGDLPKPTPTTSQESKKVPEPSTLAGLGLVGIIGVASRRKGKKNV